MDPQTLHQEKTHLDQTLHKLIEAKTRLEETMGQIGAENLGRLQELREDPQTEPHDLLFFLEQLQTKNEAFNLKDKYKRLEEFESLLKEPYFSRITLDNPSNGQQNSYYIGKFGYTEKEPLIIDWRAKVASVYYRYRYPQKNVSYDTPDGVETRDLTLKRTFEIDNGNLVKYYNNDIQLDESEIIVDKISQRTGGVLEDIVETIQEGQLDIIEADPRQVCIVQGSVGSGKSTVAIHKLSHIFFNYGELIHPERSILIAKNQILVGYLSTLFPKLGIFDVNYKTLRDLIYNLTFREEFELNINLELHQDTSDFTLDDIRSVKEKILRIHQEYEREVEELFSKDDYEIWGGFVYNPRLTIYENLSEAISDMEEELDMQKDYLKENPDSIHAGLWSDNIKTLKKIVNALKKLRNKLKETTLGELAKEIGLNIKEQIGYREIVLFSYIYAELIGLQNIQKYEYCVIDEGQDFSLLEYLILGKLVINGRLCVLGDLNQSYAEEGLTNWEDISKVIPEAKHANTFTLETNYRSTKPIIDFANSILSPYTADYLPKSINRKGSDPIVEKFSNASELLLKFESEIKKDTEALNKSIGVIVYNPSLYNQTEQILNKLGLSEKQLIRLESAKKITYIPKGVYLTSFDNAKGLEFAKVYVLGLNLEAVSTFKEAKKAFVAVTRAMNELCVYF